MKRHAFGPDRDTVIIRAAHSWPVDQLIAIGDDSRGRYVSSGRDGYVRLWGLGSNAEVANTQVCDPGQRFSILAVPGPDSEQGYLVAGNSVKGLSVYRIEDELTFVGGLSARRSTIISTAITTGPSPDLWAATRDGYVRKYDLNSLHESEQEISLGKGTITSMQICGHSVTSQQWLVVGRAEQLLWIDLAMPDRRVDMHLEGRGAVGEIVCLSDGVIVAVTDSGNLIAVDADTYQIIAQTKLLPPSGRSRFRPVVTPDHSSDNRLPIASLLYSVPGQILAWQPRSGQSRLLATTSLAVAVTSLSMVRVQNDFSVIVGGRDGSIGCVRGDASEIEPVVALAHPAIVHRLLLADVGDRQILATSSVDRVRLWNCETDQEGFSDAVSASIGLAYAATPAPQSPLLLSASPERGRGIDRWNAVTGERRNSIGTDTDLSDMVHEQLAPAVTDEDTTVVLGALRDGSVRGWDAITGLPVGRPVVHDHVVTAFAPLPASVGGSSDLIVAIGDEYGSVTLWSLLSGGMVAGGIPNSGGSVVGLIAARHPSRTIVSTLDDSHILRRWNLESAQAVGPDIRVPCEEFCLLIPGHYNYETDVIFTISDDSVLCCWDLSSGDLRFVQTGVSWRSSINSGAGAVVATSHTDCSIRLEFA